MTHETTHLQATARPCPLTPYQLGNAIMRALVHERIDSDLTAMDCEAMAKQMLEAVNVHDAAIALAKAVLITLDGNSKEAWEVKLVELAHAFEAARKGATP